MVKRYTYLLYLKINTEKTPITFNVLRTTYNINL